MDRIIKYERNDVMGSLDVTFIVRSTGERVTRHFDHPDPCWRFICKAKHSKKICLVSYPNFYY